MRPKLVIVAALASSFLASGCVHDDSDAAGLALVGAGLIGIGLLAASDDDDDGRYERRRHYDRGDRWGRHDRYHGGRCGRRYC